LIVWSEIRSSCVKRNMRNGMIYLNTGHGEKSFSNGILHLLFANAFKRRASIEKRKFFQKVEIKHEFFFTVACLKEKLCK